MQKLKAHSLVEAVSIAEQLRNAGALDGSEAIVSQEFGGDL